MPKRILNYLLKRGITAEVIQNNSISYNELGIVIPVYDNECRFLFNKYRHDPEIMDNGPKYRYDKGATVALYGSHKIRDEVIICEGEFDSLVLESNGFSAVTSTGGADSFQQEWGKLFVGKDVYVCFDNDDAGVRGKLKVFSYIPWAKNLPLPKEVGPHGDITDYFVKLKKTAEDFKVLMKVASVVNIPLPAPKKETPIKKQTRGDRTLVAIAKDVPLDHFLNFKNDFAPCPFHTDKTPSLHRYGHEKKKWKCFSCGKGGDVVDLVMGMNNISFKEAIKTLT